MNIIKGMDRIALVLAICFSIVGFIGGADDASERYRTINPEYERWAANPFLQVDEPPPMYIKEAPLWKILAFGFGSGGLSFVLVFYGIRGIVRGTIRLSKWIFEGFKS